MPVVHRAQLVSGWPPRRLKQPTRSPLTAAPLPQLPRHSPPTAAPSPQPPRLTLRLHQRQDVACTSACNRNLDTLAVAKCILACEAAVALICKA